MQDQIERWLEYQKHPLMSQGLQKSLGRMWRSLVRAEQREILVADFAPMRLAHRHLQLSSWVGLCSVGWILNKRATRLQGYLHYSGPLRPVVVLEILQILP